MISVKTFLKALDKGTHVSFYGWYDPALKGKYVISEIPKYFMDKPVGSFYYRKDGISIRIAFCN